MSEPTLHIMFSPSAAATLRQALQMASRPDDVLCLFDNFSFGPIATDDANARIQWVEEELGCTGWDDVTERTVAFLNAFGSRTTPMTAWLSRQETGTFSGFLWWLSRVGKLPISVIEVAGLSMMIGEDMLKCLDRAMPLPPEDRALYQARWEQLKIEDAPLRVIHGENLVSAPITYFDERLRSHTTIEWQKMARIVAGTLGDFYDTGIHQAVDLVLGARLADLAEAGTLDWRGDLAHMHRCELRLPSRP